MSLITLDHVKYSKGNGRLCCHVDAVHAAPPEADLHTDKIVTLLMAHTGCAGIISTVSRLQADLNRPLDGENGKAVCDYRFSIQDILTHLGIIGKTRSQLTTPYLHLAIHGMRDVHHGPYAMEIGTRTGQSCSPAIKKWFTDAIRARAREILPELLLVVDQKFVGDASILCHRFGSGRDYPGYGPNFNTVQIEIARTLRENYLPQLIELLSVIIFNFQSVFVGPRVPLQMRRIH